MGIMVESRKKTWCQPMIIPGWWFGVFKQKHGNIY
jgi:hypothetical protein